MSKSLNNKTIAILATDGFEQIELSRPKKELEDAGASVDVISIDPGQIQGMNHFDKADHFNVDKVISEATATEYDGLLLPGGLGNPDALRVNKEAIKFIKSFFQDSKPVAAICHAPWTLIEADVVKGRTLTSWPSLQTDIRNAGGTWVDKEVHVDNGLVTSRKPDDLNAFCSNMVEVFSSINK